MSGVPDYTLEDTLDFKFTTRRFSTGAPFAFASGAIEIYEDNSVTQITGAETLTLEFDGVTGLHNLRVAATAVNGFENGKSYHCVISVGTVDSVSVVGEVVQQFSIGRSAAAVDLANGTDGLTAIKADTAEIGTAGAGLSNINLPNQTMDIVGSITGNLSGSVGSVTGAVGSVTGAVGSVTADVTIDGTSVDLIWDEPLTGATHNVPTSSGRRLRALQDFGLYEGGAVWIDTVNGVAGTVDFENGTVTNPVDTIADALTIAASLNLKALRIIPASTITLAATLDDFHVVGHDYTLALGGQSVNNTLFVGATGVSGIFTGNPRFAASLIDSITGPGISAHDSGFRGTLLANAAGDWFIHHCYSAVAGATTPIFDFGTDVGVGSNVTFGDYANGIEIRNFNNSGTDRFSLSGIGQVIYAASSSGTVNQRGDWRVTNTGGVTITADDNTANLDIITGAAGALLDSTATSAQLVDDIWDEPLTKATHDVSQSSGKRLREFSSAVIRVDTAQGPGTGNNQIQLDTGASALDGAYDPSLISIVSGTGMGQTRLILEYDGTSKTATVDRNWKVNPDATSEFVISADAGRNHVNEGLAQAGSANTITLNVLASPVNDIYIGQICFIRSGTGEDQAGLIIAYNGTSKVATIDRNWGITPDTTTGYTMIPSSPIILAATTHTGAIIPTVTSADMTAISGSTTAADNLQRGSEALVLGAAAGTPTTTVIGTDLSETTTDHYVGRIITFTTGNLTGQASNITAYNGSTKELTVTALTDAPAAGNTFVIS